jgi:hypothetical protein
MKIFKVPIYAIFFIISIPLYTISASIVFIALLLKLNTKQSFKTSPQAIHPLNNEHYNANTCSYSGWPTQYIKYVVHNYFKVVWGSEFNIKNFCKFAKKEYNTSNENNPKCISNLFNIPVHKIFLNTTDTVNKSTLPFSHTHNVSCENDEVNHKQTEPYFVQA